jgi:Lon protease-like protein
MEMEPRQPVPVFPLPNVVLFPHAVVPLHVYELRYRTMVRDALAGERLIALALLKPDWEREYHGSPEFHALGCLARLEAVEWLPDGCYDLKLLGLSRVRLGTPVREHPYRAVRVELLPEAPYTEDDPVVRSERRALRDLYRRLVGRSERQAEGERPGDDLPFVALVNGVCMAAPLEADERLGLLALDSVVERGHRACELITHRLRPVEPSDEGEHN